MGLNSQYIGNLIKFMRKRAGLTQHELADRIGVGNKTVSKWEQGRGIPDISLLYQLSLVLDVDIESILAGDLEDLGKEWIGVIYTGKTENGLVSGRRDLEYIISMFLLVGIRDIAVISSDNRKSSDEILLKEYLKKGYLKRIWSGSSFDILLQNLELEKKRICFLYQLSFLYGMHLTRYMRRAMLLGKEVVLALRQGENSFMSPIFYDNNFLCTKSSKEEIIYDNWRMFPMIFGYGKYMIKYFGAIENNKNNRLNSDMLFECFHEIYVEPMERGMLAFSLETQSGRILAEQVLSGIEKSQYIQIGNPEEIMINRGWK